MKTFKKLLGIAALALVVTALVFAVFIELRFSAFRASPRVDRATLIEHPSIVFIVDPNTVREQIVAAVQEQVGYGVPAWLIERVLPYEISVMTWSDYDRNKVDLTLFINPRRLDPAIAQQVNKAGLQSLVPKIQWAAEGLVQRSPGVLTARGSVQMEPEAEEAAWFLWKQSFKAAAVPVEGGHFIEIVMDNRDGGAYLAVASLLQAFEIELDATETDISLSSLKFVLKARMHVDLTPGDTLLLSFTIEVRPDAVNRLGVINLKVGIDELFALWGETLKREHDITLVGESEWEGNVMEFRYRIGNARKMIQLAINRELL